MSDWTAQAAVGSILQQELSDDELGWEMLALMEAVDFEYERWCRVLGMDPDDHGSDEFFREIHRSWAEAWTEQGDAEFDRQVTHRVRQWRSLLGERAKAGSRG